jgi:AraC family transcriptional regulator of arabinose operon
MKPSARKPRPETPKPPGFVMWNVLPANERRTWERQWFGNELDPDATFNVRGIGIREPLFNPNVDRPMGTGDWLIMLFHKPARLDRNNPQPSAPAMTMVIWPPGAAQFYSWGRKSGTEPHSWMHVEGAWVVQQIRVLELPLSKPFQLPDDSVMTLSLTALLAEMRTGTPPDSVILQNLFENWARGIQRLLRPHDASTATPLGLVRVRRHLDADFRRIPPLDELTGIAAMSRSHLCHRFRECFGSSISEYVIRKRMSAAQRMLFDLDLRPGEIAEAVGYPDIYQFSKQFKKTFGVSPTRYRQQQVQRAEVQTW